MGNIFTICTTFLTPYPFRALIVLGGRRAETKITVKGLVKD